MMEVGMAGPKRSFWLAERTMLWGLIALAFLIRLAFIAPVGNGIYLPLRDQNTYYSLARALVDDGFLGVPTQERGPYLEWRQSQPVPEHYPAFKDSIDQAWDAEKRLYGMVEWGQPNSFFEPLFPLYSAGLYLAFGDRFFFWRLANVLLGTLLVFLVYDIGKRAFRRPAVGLLAAFYVAIYPNFVFYSRVLMAETFLVTLLALGVWCYFRLLGQPRWYWAVLLGVFFAAFALTRSFLIAFFPFMLVFVLVFLRDRHRWQYASLAALAFVLVYSPWVYRNYRLQHRLVILSTRGGYNLWMRNNPYYIADELAMMGVKFSAETLDKLNYREYILGYPPFTPEQGELERNEILTREGSKFIRANPGFFLKLCWTRFKWTIGYRGIGLQGPLMNAMALLSYGPALLGFLLSFILGWKNLKAALPLWMLVGYFVLFYTLTHEGLRYRMPVDPYMILLAVFSALTLYDVITTKRKNAEEN